MWCWLYALVAQMCGYGWPVMLACAPLTCLLCLLLPHTTHASGSPLLLQQVSDRLAARHVVLVVCSRCPDVSCWLAMLTCAPLTSPLCSYLSLPYTFFWIPFVLQNVSNRLASRHVLLVMCLGCPDVWLSLAGYASMCPPDLPALFSFALPHTCIWIPPDIAAGERSACPPCGAGYAPSLPRCVLMAGYACMCPSDLPALFSFALPHTCIWIPPISAGCK